MTDPSASWRNRLRDRRLVLGTGFVAIAAVGFTAACFLLKLITDSVAAQLIIAVPSAALAPVLIWNVIRSETTRFDTDSQPPGDLWGRILGMYGMGILLFPSVCPAAADVLQKYIPPFFYYAVGISGGISVCVFIGMIWLKVLKTCAGVESQTNDGD